jgi:alpha-tubulin suppressor-like RCC1 family protein
MMSLKSKRMNRFCIGAASSSMTLAALVVACNTSSTNPEARGELAAALSPQGTTVNASCQAIDLAGADTTGPNDPVQGSTFFAIDLSGNVWGWGYNGNWNPGSSYIGGNPLGFDNEVGLVTSPMKLGISGATHLAAHQQGACAITAGGAVSCVGQQLGVAPVDPLGTTPTVTAIEQSTDYYDTTPLTGAVGITAGLSHACVWKADGSVWCWGSDKFGQLGDGSNGENGDASAPTTITRVGASSSFAVPMRKNGLPLTDVTQVAAGFYTTCILHRTGTVECVGSNASGELGQSGLATNGKPTGDLIAPKVNPGTVFTSIFSGTGATGGMFCGNTSAPTVATLCWGYNADAQTAITNDNAYTPAPFQVSSASGSTWALGALNACEANATGGASCWGQNSYGQIPGGTANQIYETEQPITGVSGGYKVAVGYSTLCTLANNALWCWGSNVHGELGIGSTTAATGVQKVRLSVPALACSLPSGAPSNTQMCGDLTNSCGETLNCGPENGACPANYACTSGTSTQGGYCKDNPTSCSATCSSTQFCYNNGCAQYCSANGNPSFGYDGTSTSDTVTPLPAAPLDNGFPIGTGTSTIGTAITVPAGSGAVLGVAAQVQSPAGYGSTGCDGYIWDVTIEGPADAYDTWYGWVTPAAGFSVTQTNCPNLQMVVSVYDEVGNQLYSSGTIQGAWANNFCNITNGVELLNSTNPKSWPISIPGQTGHFRVVGLLQESSSAKGGTVWSTEPIQLSVMIPTHFG